LVAVGILWEYVYLCHGIERMTALYVERRGIGTRNYQCTVFNKYAMDIIITEYNTHCTCITSTYAQEVRVYQALATCHGTERLAYT
jgi:hypothetical protein